MGKNGTPRNSNYSEIRVAISSESTWFQQARVCMRCVIVMCVSDRDRERQTKKKGEILGSIFLLLL
jgi:hypothetical protein